LTLLLALEINREGRKVRKGILELS